MDTSRKPIFNFDFRVFAMSLIICLFLGVKTYALDNYSGVISPYWQTDTSSYTFIAVTHPSLENMASGIGLTITALTSDTSAYSDAVTFTISAGETKRIFIVRTAHSVINSTIIPSAEFIRGTTDYSYGNVVITPVATKPENYTTARDGDGNRDVTMLHYFGGIVFDASTTGFAMEFIGDLGDSAAHANLHNSAGVNGVN